MAPSIEIRTTQKTALYEILMLKRNNDKAEIKIIGLNELIVKMKVAMEAEDVAYVEKMIEEL